MPAIVCLSETFTAWVGAGLFGALRGLGGSAMLAPLLTLVMGIDIHYAIGASIVSVIASASCAAAVYLRDGVSNIRIGMFLETAITTGHITGALVGGVLIVPAMDIAMKLPMKVPTATSNFIIGVTAARAGVYFIGGNINPFIAAPVAPGVLPGG